jgi:LEA14-like dessication related protein
MTDAITIIVTMGSKIMVAFVAAVVFVILAFLSSRYLADVDALQHVEIEVEGIGAPEIRVTHCRLTLYVKISNPTKEDISGLSADFDVYIAGTYVGNGSLSEVYIPAGSNTLKEVTLKIYYAYVADAVIDGLKAGKFDLTIEGVVRGYVFFNLIVFSNEFSASYSYP